MPFIEALRQLSFSVGKPVNPPPLLLGFLSFTASYIDVASSLLGQENFCLIHVSLIPVLGVVGEQVVYYFLTFKTCAWLTLVSD